MILYEVAERIATITLHRPEAMNAFGGAMREDLLARLQDAGTDRAVRCIIITGAGKAFCAGGDIASMAELQAQGDVTVIEQRMAAAAQVVTCLRALPKPVIAAVNGAAAGGGMNLALACDLRYAAASAKFAESFIKIGLVPDWGGHFLLTQLVGSARALELIMTGDRIDAAEAERLGIVNRIFPDADFQVRVRERAHALAAAPAAAIAAIKHGVYQGARGTLAATLAYELAAQRSVFLSADAREGMQAFLEKRPAIFGPLAVEHAQ
jgi:2-(1,2-epoxy-1,2-dihydrophenyl)acetyl-CoA isomerase